MIGADKDTRATWAAGIHRVLEQAAGVLDVQVVRQEDAAELIGFALNGDPTARKVLLAVNSALAGIQDAPPNAPALCACCPAPLSRSRRYSIAVAFPRRDEADMALGFAICGTCGPTIKAAEAKVAEALAPFAKGGRIMPAPTHDGGRA